jgi:homoserine/homoserine lactone efflux protein
MNWQLFAGFVAVTVVLLLTPGPIVTLVISTSTAHGLRAGLITVAGTSTGNAVLLVAIACGVKFVLGHALYVFEMLRWCGVAYLLWLGVRAWRRASQPAPPAPRGQVHFWRGVGVALTNPKTLAFFTAFLPQFVDPTKPAAMQLTVMCAVSVLMAACSDSCWAIASGAGRVWFARPARTRALGRLSAVTLIGAGIWLSFARRPV